MNRHRSSKILPLLSLLLGLLSFGVAQAEDTWVDELSSTVTFYQQTYPNAEWQPYLETVSRMRDGVRGSDASSVQKARAEFVTMLRDRAYGINDVAAEDLIQMALSSDAAMPQEMPMSIPDQSIKAHTHGEPGCQTVGCDYWRDDVFDAGAG